jgi:hypothetical protein
MDAAVMVLSILFMQKIIIIFEKSCKKIWWLEIKALYLYQEIKTTTL